MSYQASRCLPRSKQSYTFADIILPIPLPKSLTYSIPEHCGTLISRGSRVIVPIGSRKILTGIVEKLHTQIPSYPTKKLIDVLDENPVINSKQLRFFHWLAEYYLCTIGEVVLAALPNGLRLSSQSKIQLHPELDLVNCYFNDKEQLLIAALKRCPDLTYAKAMVVTGQKNIYYLIKGLLKKKAILLFEEIEEKYKPKKIKLVRLSKAYAQHQADLQNLFELLGKHQKQLDTLRKYIAQVPIPQLGPLEDLFVAKQALIQAGASSFSIQTLIKKQIFIEEEVEESCLDRDNAATQQLPVLDMAPKTALASIYLQFQKKEAVLLHVLGTSERTAIYSHLIQNVIQSNGQVLYLLPEIVLTDQVFKKLKRIFGNQVESYHSRHTSHERIEIWNRILHGKCSFVIGTRSALFLPFNQLGLIIVDEEQETSYKRSHTMPRYHTRDAALVLAQYHRAKVLLGSATPAIETYYNAQNGKYGLVRLQEQLGHVVWPEVVLANLRIERQRKTLREGFTKLLLADLQQALAQQEHALIFHNKKGYAPYITCTECTWVPMCAQCAVSLTYHQFSNQLKCHYCSYRTQPPYKCSICGSTQLKNIGLGTEKVEETLQLFFPSKYIQRIDLNTAQGKYKHEKLIKTLNQDKIDVLVGTQKITKFLSYFQASLVGVLDVDQLLHFPNFRANEYCFKLLTQLSTQTCRRAKQGKIIIQTNHPQHPILQDAVQHNYEQMYRRELIERKQFRYPPYIRLIRITCKQANKSLVADAARVLANRLLQQLGEGVLGPQAPLVSQVKKQYLMDIWVKIKKDTEERLALAKQLIMQECKHFLLTKEFKLVRIIIDVDPI